MKILVFSTQHMPTGGIESHLKEFCLHMAEANVEIDLLITNASMLPETEEFYRRICRRVYLGKFGRSSARLLWILSVLRELRFRDYDTLYTNGQGESVFFLSKLVANYKRWVHHHHTAGDAADQAHWGNRYWRALRKADHVIACSQTNAAIMSLALSRPVETIPCFSRAIIPKQSDTSKTGRIRLGYYGRLIPEKGIDLICKLSEDTDIHEAEFHIWGEGDAYPPRFFDQYPNVMYHGTFNGRDELAQVLGSLDTLLLLTTHGEGLPISLLEAMSAGLPWLATERGGIPDIALDPGATRLLPASADYPQIKRGILDLIEDLKAGRVSSQKQIDLYAHKFSADVLVTQWSKLFGMHSSKRSQTAPLTV